MNISEIKDRLLKLDSASLCDADKSLGIMDPGIRPLASGYRLVGRARTVSCRRDFLSVIQALASSDRDDVLVVDGGGEPVALAGELFSTEAQRKGLAGMVFDGGIRDSAQIRTLGLPVFSRWITPRAGSASTVSRTGQPVVCGGVPVEPGDILFGDDDGVVVIPAAKIESVAALAGEIQRKEEAVLHHMAEGGSLLERLNFQEHRSRIEAGKPSRLKFLV